MPPCTKKKHTHTISSHWLLLLGCISFHSSTRVGLQLTTSRKEKNLKLNFVSQQKEKKTSTLIFLNKLGIFSSSNGRLPHSRAYRITPQLHTSTSGPAYIFPDMTCMAHHNSNKMTDCNPPMFLF